MIKYKKKKVVILAGIIVLLGLIIGTGIFLYLYFRDQKIIKEMPFLVFETSSAREDSIFFCSNGDMYQGFSEESFLMRPDEIAQRIQENRYDGLLRYLGNCGEKETRQMYVLFYRVCRNGKYQLERPLLVPTSQQNGGKRYSGRCRDYCGYYFNDDGKLNIMPIYSDLEECWCSDERAYKVVDWMHDCIVKCAQ